MSEQQRQHLSALVDEEIDPALIHPTLSALESSQDLKAAWERYHLISAALRSEPVREEYRRIAVLVRERVAAEPVPLIKKATRRGSTLRIGPFAGAALAATAAFLAVFAVPQLFTPTPSPNAKVPSRLQASSSLPEQGHLPGPSRRWHLDKPALETKLDRFLVNHQEYPPVSQMKGFLPYATVVGYEAGR